MSKRSLQNLQKVIPFRGELLEAPPQEAIPDLKPAYGLLAIFIAVGAAAFGGLATYQSSSQSELRSLKMESQQLHQIHKQLCKE